VRSLFRRGGLEPPVEAAITLEQPAERVLALKLARFAETLHAVAEQSLPHLLCGYLYELAVAFTGFYENCPVLKADGPLRESRLALSELTARTIRRGLELLGIETIEQM
jgi:arginyl-tRNA synthetase